MKAPSTAKFSEETVEPSPRGKGLYIRGKVTAQNAFGATITEDYWATIQCEDHKPVIVYASMPGVTWGTEYDAIMLEHSHRIDSILNDTVP